MENDYQGKSKSQAKREAEALQELGEELIKLSRQQLEEMGLPDGLHNALIDAGSIKSNIAARRHRQFIGTLMRDVDPEPIRRALVETLAGLSAESGIANQARTWLDRLSTGEAAAMESFMELFPGLDRQRLRQLVRNIKKDKAAGKCSKSSKALEHFIITGMKGR
ncbi:MAG: DUF615 domain-containing protein [Proteobacteria bacterium]|nr:DUF615 domain-containing protein [Pseudomonadota bacterium]